VEGTKQYDLNNMQTTLTAIYSSILRNGDRGPGVTLMVRYYSISSSGHAGACLATKIDQFTKYTVFLPRFDWLFGTRADLAWVNHGTTQF
jgi:hypothetical protein